MKVKRATTRAVALNWAAFNSCCVRALGVTCFQTPSTWWREPGGSPIYLAALLLDPNASDQTVFDELVTVHEAWKGSPIQLYDFWASRELSELGYTRIFQNPWYGRSAAPIEPYELPRGLFIEIVETSEQLAEFERASHIGFDNSEASLPQRFAQHAEATLDESSMFYLNARLRGQVVASTIAYAAENVLSIYAISVLAPFRRRGYGTALVHAAVALRPDLPVSVYPDPPSVPMYTRWGFSQAEEIACWLRK
jgi:GNAT superfamily N-acetyltransferase